MLIQIEMINTNLFKSKCNFVRKCKFLDKIPDATLWFCRKLEPNWIILLQSLVYRYSMSSKIWLFNETQPLILIFSEIQWFENLESIFETFPLKTRLLFSLKQCWGLSKKDWMKIAESWTVGFWAVGASAL